VKVGAAFEVLEAVVVELEDAVVAVDVAAEVAGFAGDFGEGFEGFGLDGEGALDVVDFGGDGFLILGEVAQGEDEPCAADEEEGEGDAGDDCADGEFGFDGGHGLKVFCGGVDYAGWNGLTGVGNRLMKSETSVA